MSTTIYAARRILTMNPSNPEASHVAVRAGRILGVGPLGDLVGWGEHTIDNRFADKVLMPGLVEGHSLSSRARSGATSIVATSTGSTPMAGCGPEPSQSTR